MLFCFHNNHGTTNIAARLDTIVFFVVLLRFTSL